MPADPERAAPEAEPLPPLPDDPSAWIVTINVDVGVGMDRDVRLRWHQNSEDDEPLFDSEQVHDYGQECIDAARAPLLARIEELEAEKATFRGALCAAVQWIKASDHGDNCFLHDDGGEYDRCFCGKDSLSDAIWELLPEPSDESASQGKEGEGTP